MIIFPTVEFQTGFVLRFPLLLFPIVECCCLLSIGHHEGLPLGAHKRKIPFLLESSKERKPMLSGTCELPSTLCGRRKDSGRLGHRPCNAEEGNRLKKGRRQRCRANVPRSRAAQALLIQAGGCRDSYAWLSAEHSPHQDCFLMSAGK